mgnify:FL=1
MYEYEKYLATSESIKETLDKFGVAIIPNILDEEECKKMTTGMFDFFEHITSPWEKPFKIGDRSTWRELYKLMPMHSMLFQHWKIGHSQHVWDVRQNPKVTDTFAKIWSCKPEELLVSFDGASFHLPPENTNKGWFNKQWFHTDQSFLRNDFECIQSWVTSLDVKEGDATLSFMEGSHLFHKDFAEHSGIKEKSDWYKLNDDQIDFFTEKGCETKRIKCPKGSLILWDSRTIHCGVEALKGREKKNFRSIIYLCMTPRSKCPVKDLEKKKKAFEEMRMTTHWPHKPKLFPKMPRTYGNVIPPVEDISPPVLTELGRKLAGF